MNSLSLNILNNFTNKINKMLLKKSSINLENLNINSSLKLKHIISSKNHSKKKEKNNYKELLLYFNWIKLMNMIKSDLFIYFENFKLLIFLIFYFFL